MNNPQNTHASVTFKAANGETHQAIFCFSKQRASGIIERVGTDKQWGTLLNATPEETLQILKDEYNLPPTTLLALQLLASQQNDLYVQTGTDGRDNPYARVTGLQTVNTKDMGDFADATGTNHVALLTTENP
jgi:hypothetical protein